MALKISSPKLLRIIGLFLGFVPSAFFLVFLIGEGLADLIDGKLAVIPILVMMILAVSGYILAWKRQKAGGIIMISGGLVMGFYLLILGGFYDWQMAFFYSFPFILPGVFFVYSSKKSPVIRRNSDSVR
jgi:hypothetical protein